MKTSKFKLIFLGVCIIFVIAGVVAFATYRGNATENRLPPITVWGTLPADVFNRFVTDVNQTLEQRLTVNYTQKSATDFSADFVAALARGAGPDAVIIVSDALYANEDKLLSIPYAVLPQRTFMDRNIDAASIYLAPEGILGVPLAVDPLVMYWNRDIFNAAGIATPPRDWDALVDAAGKITIKNDSGTITRSGVAMGDFANVVNAREILASLLFQAGNPITVVASGRQVSSAFKAQYTETAEPAIEFFTRFVNPSDQAYSWNRSWPDSKTAFLSGRLGIYFGLASELADIRTKNPNLNFDVSPLPQGRRGGVVATYARLYGISIVRATRNADAVYQVISTLVLPQNIAKLSARLYQPSVSRPVLSAGSTDPYIAVFNQAALISKVWLDAGAAESSQVFGAMTQAVTSGQKSMFQALRDAADQYDLVLRQARGQ